MTTVRPSTSQKTPTFSPAETFGTILLDISPELEGCVA